VLPVPVVQAHSKATHRRVIVGVDFVVQEGAAAAHAETRIEGEEQQGAGHGPWTAPARRLRVLAVHRRQQHQVCRMSISMSMAVSMSVAVSVAVSMAAASGASGASGVVAAMAGGQLACEAQGFRGCVVGMAIDGFGGLSEWVAQLLAHFSL
jgi:hypothetical protein